MNEPSKKQPPRFATRLLQCYCKPELLEDLQGDLNEYFERNIQTKSLRHAKLIYVTDVFKFFRLYTIRKPEIINLLINFIMIGSYIKTSSRSILRNKLFSTINIVGLAISMSVGLVMIGVLTDTFSYDKFHINHKRIYRVISTYEYLGNKDNQPMATTSLKAGNAIKETFTAPEAVAIIRRDFEGDIKFNEKEIPLNGYWTNPDFFRVFSFELIKGNPANALKEPFSIVLTEKSAKKLFNDTEALGKTVVFNNGRQYTITGVVKDPPVFSHIRFDMLASLSTREVTERDNKNEASWDHVWNTWVYLMLPAEADMNSIKISFDKLSAKENPTVKNTKIELNLQPLDNIMTGVDLGNQIGPVMGSSTLWIFGGLAFVVILSACFNYTNLSIARSLKRTREVGIRKVIGAMKGQVAGQFIVEAIIISLCALLLGFVMFVLLRPYFLSIEPELHETLVLELSPTVVVYFILFAIFVGASAGFFPALFFSRVNAVQVLKNLSATRVFKKLTLRKVLIIFQYCISIILITSSIIIYKQYKHFVAFDLGFETENILNISLQGNKAEILEKELTELPEVKGISRSMMITSVGNYWGTNMKYRLNPNDSSGVGYNIIDENYFPLHDHNLLAGRNFIAKSDSAKETEVIVNQQVLKRFNIAGHNTAKAIGEVVRIDKQDMVIIGVMKDFHYGRANTTNSNTKEIVFRYSNSKAHFLNVKIQSTDLLATLSKIEAIWKKIDPVHPIEAKFYSEQIDEAFAGLKASVKMASFLAFLAICIASMGLLGMVVFTTETRLKEISIRKVMGASEIGLLYLLGKGFFVLLGIAVLISLPFTILFFEKIAFPELANHAPLSIPEMLLGVLGILVIAVLMIGSQTLKVARTNPAEVLKSE
jgi:ABC-type antimicrobial peptide transport system permease subunit